MVRDEMEEIYRERPSTEIPWNIASPPQALVELVESKQLQPCRTIDLGCGAGNYAIYLASPGYEVTGVDISPSAIALAEANAKQKTVSCRFVVADVLAGLTGKLEALDTEGEWFHDEETGTLYLWAPGGVDPGSLRIETKARVFGLPAQKQVTYAWLALSNSPAHSN